MDDQHAYQALKSRDSRFDGWFFAGVTSTGVYCRPSCPAVMPRREHVCFFPTAAAAQAAGFRACKRCRPDAAPGDADSQPGTAGTISLPLPYRPPLDLAALLRFLAVRAIPGVEEYTDGAFRPDVFMPTDLGVRHALTRLGRPADPTAAAAAAQRWRPWRSYALQHLWGVLDDQGAGSASPPLIP